MDTPGDTDPAPGEQRKGVAMKVDQVLSKASGMLTKMLVEYAADIHGAYLKAEGGISIGLTVKLTPTKDPSKVVVEIVLNFVSERIKDQKQEIVDEAQNELFKAVERLRPKKGSGDESLTLEQAK